MRLSHIDTDAWGVLPDGIRAELAQPTVFAAWMHRWSETDISREYPSDYVEREWVHALGGGQGAA